MTLHDVVRWTGEARKFLVFLAGALAQLIALGVLSGAALRDVQLVATVLTGVLLYRIPNDQPPIVPNTAAPGEVSL